MSDHSNKSIAVVQTDGEIWKDVLGWEGFYQISSHGRVKSVSRHIPNSKGRGTRHLRGRIMRLRHDKNGYLLVTLRRTGQKLGSPIVLDQKVHRLVGAAFIPNPHDKPHINHKNGIKDDNNKSNLEWCTVSENAIHAIASGLKKPHYPTEEQREYLSEIAKKRMAAMSDEKKKALYIKSVATRKSHFTEEQWREISRKGGLAKKPRKKKTVELL